MTDCSRIRTLLSDYMDGALDPKEKELAEEHLRTCSACREELDALKALAKGLGSLESVNAPADFLDQLHHRMERPPKLSRIREWLFYPLQVKIPLQLAGAAVLALLIFSILPLQQSSLKLSSKPVQENKDAAYVTDEAKGMLKPAQSPEALTQETTAPGAAKQTMEVTLHLKKQIHAKAGTAELSSAQVPAQPALSEKHKRKLAARAPLQEDKNEEAVETRPEAVSSITAAIEAAQGKVLSIDHDQQTGRPESIHAEMPAEEVPLFYEKLKELGDLQLSPETGTQKGSGLVHVKIKLIVSP